MPSTRRPSEVPRPKMITPRAEGEEARKGCAELAVLIAGSEAPSWFVRHLEYAAIRVAVMRNVDKTAHKARYKSELKNARKTFANTKRCLSDPLMRALLNEKFVSENHESMLAFIERMKKNPETTSPWDAPKPNWGIAGFQGDLFKIIDELISCTEFALNSPELAGSGRGRAYLPRRVSPQQYCAFNVAAAILHFHDPDQRPKGKKAETYAEKLWEASTTALGPTVKFEGNRDKKTLITWRHYFHPDCYKDGFCAFEECRLGLGTAAYFGESETSHK